jgi:hypothetical protein
VPTKAARILTPNADHTQKSKPEMPIRNAAEARDADRGRRIIAEGLGFLVVESSSFPFWIFDECNKKLPNAGLLEMTSDVCFVWVTAISNRGLRY